MEYINKSLSIVAIVLLFVNAIYFSIKLKFPQFNIKKAIIAFNKKENKKGISSLNALCMSLASKIGIGSLAGIAFAIYYGGIGTIFWIWLFSLFVVINSFLENYLAIVYKEKDKNFYKGGPAYYIKKGLNNKLLANIYAICLIFAYIFGFLSIQSNTTVVLINSIFSIDKVIISIALSLLASYFIFKGLKTISGLCNKIVPIMSAIYVIIGIIIVISNINHIPELLKEIITQAFNYRSIGGGFLVSIFIGIQKSIFSSEAGIGTGAIASGTTNNENPIKQGYVGVIETYFITLFITTITAFIIGLSNYKNVSFNNINGIELTKYAFFYHLGAFGEAILLLLIILFAFSTIVTGYYYGESNLKLFTNKNWPIFALKIITIGFLFIGGITNSLIVWKVVDAFVAILAIINVYAVYKLKDKIKL